ncbi:F-actin-monooxygenase Mical isoform X5 [Maniola jurtina]|uniref:F-actin-monooxygenase Mical isoform X5 n=1 Tax=Maniola jurtina TaxID=191418 RepID=UPI001E68EE68|nr:F-actin-monooxygenase Mical isoform X5 [Maniola jurtina]
MCNTYKYLAPTMNRGGRVEPTPPECALAAEMFDLFCAAGTMKQILALHREICATLNLKPNRLPDFYPKLKGKLSSSWKAQALFKKFDVRANLKVFGKGRACERNKVLIIGAGPCGLRAAIECQLLGAKVVVIEKRDRLSRNNVLHLWPFVIHDLKALGAKKFFGKFCAGSIDHISIRQLQCILLKVSLLLGVEIHEGVSFEEHLEPTTTEKSETLGWRARVSPAEHPVAQYEFDVLIGADGKRNTLQGFKRKEFRGKLAMAITANFINRHTEQEAAVPEISGVAYIFNQKFFKDLKRETGIDLENIVYYKDDTHYFVMTAKKQSLIDKGVLLNDYGEISRLLSAENMDRAALMRYAQEAARFSTDNRLPRLDFALNHYGEPDVALFDFTSMYAAENASMVYERRGRRLLCQLVGDSLLEPFWPTGSGCARGFLSALDAAWTVRAWGQNPPLHPLQLIAERESVYRLLAQTTPENLHRDFGTYTLDPCTRYPNLNRAAVTPHRVTALYDSDEPLPLDATPPAKRRRREPEISEEALVAWVGYSEPGMRAATSAPALCALMRRYRPDLLQADSSPRSVYSIFQHQLGIPPFITSESDKLVPEPTLRCYLLRVYQAFKGEVPHVYHKTDMFEQIKKSQQSEKSNRNVTERPYSNAGDTESHSSYRRKRRSLRPQQEEGRAVGGVSRAAGGGARVARLAAELAHPAAPAVSPPPSKPRDLMRSVGKIEPEDWNVKLIEQKIMENRLGRPERKTAEKVPKWDREQFLRRQRRLKEGDPNEDKWGDIDETIHKIDQQLNDSGRPLLGTKRVAKLATKFIKKCEPDSEKKEHKKEEPKKPWSSAAVAASGAACAACGSTVFAAEGVVADGLHLHRACFKCAVCDTILRPGNYTTELFGTRLVCLRHTGVTATDSAAPRAGPSAAPTATPERISLELSDGGAREIDEDEWTDRNFLASETSGAGGLSDEDESSSDEYTDAAESDTRPQRSPEPAAANSHSPRAHHIYFSDDSFGYDDYSDDGAESSGNESCSRMRAAREARRREVPAEARPPTDSSEVESEDESESSEEEISSATEVSTDSEFAREECAPAASPPAILVTEAPPPAPPPHHDYPLIRTRSAGGLATKRALELKRRYLLGEPSPPVVRKSDSTSQLDTKLEAFRSNITEIQKLLLPAPPQTQKPVVTFQLTTVEKKPMPDIIQNLCSDAPVDLLTKGDSVLCNTDWREPTKEENRELDIESDSLSDEDSSHTQTLPNQSVPRVEVHDEGGELIQLDSLMIISSSAEDNERGSGTATATGPTVLAAESESSDSCRDATTLALTETELSDWAAESVVLDDCSIDEKEDRKRSKRPRSLSGPKLVHETKNISAIASHVCGKTSPAEPIMFSNALDHFEFADEGDQDPSIETPVAPRNEGYVEFVDDEYDHYSPNKDRSMNFIERSFSETTVKPYELEESIGHDLSEEIKYIDDQDSKTESLSKVESLKSSLTQTLISESSENVVAPSNNNYSSDVEISTQNSLINNDSINNFESKSEFTGVSDKSQTIENNDNENRKREPKSNESKSEVSLEDISPPLASEKSKSQSSITYNLSKPFANPCSIRMYAPAICRSASETFNNNIRIANSPTLNISLSPSYHSVSTVTTSPTPERETIEKVQELKKEREEQTEVVRRLVLERLGSGQRAGRKSARRHRAAPGGAPPPVPPPPAPSPPPPPRPAPPLAPLPVSPSLSDSDLTHETRRKGIMRSISNYFNKRLGPRQKCVSEPDLTTHNEPQSRHGEARKSTGALQEAPPVPPPPAIYSPPANFQISPANQTSTPLRRPGAVREGREGERAGDEDERDAMQLWFEARWARLVAQRRAREESRDEPGARRLARLQRRLSRPLSAEQQAATVAEVVQVSAQRDAHQALAAANRQRHSSRNGVGH